ncbi:peptidase M24, structural domain-containing protein [Halteromyces radiatus]|uniref:peptidase M24, structural domain-containing protein n=1 Tax=Halteromyces radiatus TaxID=101107 RepID=UPI0022206B9D|nr:peptidase M24, structural domain-containing protein [Halteromyces radiatus]KAI8089190.1 peptidase M24, structural domain-containing protein [Halteromyces radiatus]
MANVNETTPFLQPSQGGNHWNKMKQRSMFLRVILALGVLLALVCGIWMLQSYQQQQPSDDTWQHDLDKLTQAGQACRDGISRIPGSQYIERQQRLAKALDDDSAFVLEPSPSMIYYTNMTWSRTERPFLVVFTRNQQSITGLDMTIITPLFEETRAKEQVSQANLPIPIHMVAWVEHGSPFETAKQVLGHVKTVQVEPSTRFFIVDGLQRVMNNVIMASTTVQQLRMVKSPEELAIMRCANQLTELAIRTVKRHVQVGMTENTIADKMTQALEHIGLIHTWVVALVDDNAAFPHGQPGKTNQVQSNSLVLIDTGGELYGYQSDTTRTFFLQDYNNKTVEEAWYTVQRAQDTVLKTMKQGHSCAQVDLAARGVIEQAGWGDFFTHRLGHGIGLEMHEDPYMNQGNTECTLQPGFTFSVEPGVYVPLQFGIRLEDIVVVNQQGDLELLTNGLASSPWTL